MPIKSTASPKRYRTRSSSSTIQIWEMSVMIDTQRNPSLYKSFSRGPFRCTAGQKPLHGPSILNSLHLTTKTRVWTWASQNVSHTKFQGDTQPNVQAQTDNTPTWITQSPNPHFRNRSSSAGTDWLQVSLKPSPPPKTAWRVCKLKTPGRAHF